MRVFRSNEHTLEPRVTAHARTRMRQRAIRPRALQLALLYGREVHTANAIFVVVGRREVEKARVAGDDIQFLEGIHVVCSIGGSVITVYRDRTLRALKHARRAE
jgi:hypothetical protein